MKYSREYLDQRSADTGFRPDTLEKVLRLLRLLDQVTRHPFLGSRLLLKGGTALNLFYAAAPRLSVDLDFNYVGSVARDQMLRERPEVERAANQVVVGEGYWVQWGRDEHAGRKLYLTYVSGLGSQDRIELDLNYLFRVPLAEPELRPAWTPDPDFPCEARIVSREEVMAGKLLALLDRVAARDLYDVAAFAAGPSACRGSAPRGRRPLSRTRRSRSGCARTGRVRSTFGAFLLWTAHCPTAAWRSQPSGGLRLLAGLVCYESMDQFIAKHADKLQRTLLARSPRVTMASK